jgi:hypothetical protein
MKTNISTILIAALATTTLLGTTATPAFAATSFTLEKRAPAQAAPRYGDIPLGALIRTDERYGKDPLI